MICWCTCGAYVNDGVMIFGIYCPFCERRIVATISLPSNEIKIDEGIIVIQYHEYPFPYDMMNEDDVKEIVTDIEVSERMNQSLKNGLKHREEFMQNSGLL